MIFAKLGMILSLLFLVGCSPITVQPQPIEPLKVTGQPKAPQASDYTINEEKQYIHDLQKYMYDMMSFITETKRRNGDHDYVYHKFVLPEIAPPPKAPSLQVEMSLNDIEQAWNRLCFRFS